MTLKVAINGFGRIGRCVLRAAVESGRSDIEIVAINDLAPAEAQVHLLNFDSVHGRLRDEAELDGDALRVGGRTIRATAIREPAELPWDGVDVAFECTGLFTDRDRAAAHLDNGSRRVLVSAPSKGADRTVVFGVNHTDLAAEDLVVSNASCTTNCLAPVAKALDDAFGLKTGYMTTIHAYTGDQPTHDAPHKDLYRARAAALSMIPTSTGAARAISEVLPHLKGRLEGSAIRVPTANVSLVDLSFVPEKAATVDEINGAVREAAAGALQGILAYEERPLVSMDFNHDAHSSIFAAPQTAVTSEGLVRVVSWYDNEWGFSNRMLDTAQAMGALK